MQTHEIGDIELMVVTHGRGSGTGAWMFPSVDREEREAGLAPHVDADGHIAYVFTSAIVKTPEAVLLIDAGFPIGPGTESPLASALASLDLTRADVSDVVITHGHHDHVGGLVDTTGEPIFAGARHLIGHDELAHLDRTEPDGPVARVAAVGLVEAVDGAGSVVTGVAIVPAPGHTPGHLAVEIESRGRRALHAGDAIAHEANVAHPGWNHFSDMVDSPTAESRRSLVARAREGNHVLVASHVPTVGVVTPRGRGAELVPVTTGTLGAEAAPVP